VLTDSVDFFSRAGRESRDYKAFWQSTSGVLGEFDDGGEIIKHARTLKHRKGPLLVAISFV
jgi:hypothetical protein